MAANAGNVDYVNKEADQIASVPLKDLRGDLMGALSVLMPIQGESSEAVVKRIVPVLQEAAQSLRNLI